MKVGKNDTVIVISGDDKGKVGKVLKVFVKGTKGSKVPRVVVEKVNFIKRHTRKTRQNPQGGVIEREAPIPVSHVLLYCSKCERGTRVGYRRLADGTKVRFCRGCDELIAREEK